MRRLPIALFFALFSALPVFARVIVFQEPGFPTVDSEPVSPATLQNALGSDVVFADISALNSPDEFRDADLLVLPYGSAVPIGAWAEIEAYLKAGGNLLVIGGQPLHVPVSGHQGAFAQQSPQDTFGRVLDFRHSYAVPMQDGSKFSWRDGYQFLPKLNVRAKQFFAVEGRLNGLGYMESADGTKVAAPVIVADHQGGQSGSRIVALDFDPEPGYLESADGIALIRAAASYARRGSEQFWVEAQYSTLRPGESPQLTLHWNHPGAVAADKSAALVELYAGSRLVESAHVEMQGNRADTAVAFTQPLAAGFYAVRATYAENGKPLESYSNGFQVEAQDALENGPALGVDKDFLTLGGKPFLPVGTNYFTTEENGWDFSGPRNALVWENDFADMERHGVSFVRTGVWMSNAKFVEPLTGEVNERFLRNLEAYLAAAQRHHIAINFTCFAMIPRMGDQSRRSASGVEATPPNPYLDPATVHAEQQYVLSIVDRFKRVPWLSYDLINEPSFSNPRRIFHGNVPNGDPAEVSAWHAWLRERYQQVDALAEAWRVDPGQLKSFEEVALPQDADLVYERSGNQHEGRAFDYNLFAQAMFAGWVKSMVNAIRSTGSTQLINVGQDEGGVTDRLLNRFYGNSGVSFSTNHTYWQDDALLWDSVAAKTPGIPNITGETGYQPAWAPDGTWRYDELTGSALEERKWALGFAAGSSGAMQWDWAREVDFGIERSDGSAKIWESMMRELGRFAKEAAPYATGWTAPEVAVVLPQSLQLSVYNAQALAAQQAAVRVLYNYNRATAYAIGEYQIETLGSPKLIILPSAYGLTEASWKAIESHVRDGAVLLISGPFAMDEHLHPTKRAAEAGIDYKTTPLELREQAFRWPGDPIHLSYGGLKTTTLSRAALADGKDWMEEPLGKGKILFSTLPLELNDRLDAVAAVYAYALKAAGIEPVYRTSITDPGMLICPTVLPEATLYVLTSETNNKDMSFDDQRSGKHFAGQLEPGHAALLLVGKNGNLISSYGWTQ
jgi:hypothetical protein